MKNTLSKERINTHFEYDWYKYLIVIVAVLFGVLFVFNRIGSNKKEERFIIFFSAHNLYDNNYSASVLARQDSSEYAQEKFGKPILREVNFDFAYLQSSEYTLLYGTRGLYSSDAMVAPVAMLQSEDGSFSAMQGFIPLDEQALIDMGIDSSYELLRVNESFERVQSGGTVYAIRVDNLQKINKLAVFNIEQEANEFYLALLPQGGNVGTDSDNRQAFFCLKVFFEMYGN